MKFVVFNIVVIGAFIFLIAGNSDGRITMPKLDAVTSNAEETLSRLTGSDGHVATRPAPQTPIVETSARRPEDESTPTQPSDGPGIAQIPQDPEASSPQVAETPATPPVPRQSTTEPITPAAEAAEPAQADLPPDVARRRAEVLGEVPSVPKSAAAPTNDRRRQLLDLAEEMEYLAAKFAVR